MFRKSEKSGEDIKNTLEMGKRRRSEIDSASAKPLPVTYGINELAKSLHPISIPAEIVAIKECTSNSKIITFKSLSENKRFPFFKAGQYITVSAKVGSSIVTRPYSIFSSPNEAYDKGILEIGVQNAGFFSNFLANEAKIGTHVIIGEPSGDFYYDNIRDYKNIVGIAGGSGITPFVSMIKSILEGSDDFNLTVIYGVKTLKDMMFDPSKINDKRIKVVVVLSNEEVEGYEHGFINGTILKKYIPENSSIFMCGPNVMYNFVTNELVKLGYDVHSLRPEHNCVRAFPLESPKSFMLIVHMRNEVFTIPTKENETLLDEMERAGLVAPSRCRSGYCGFCHSRVISGTYYTPKENDHRRQADIKFNYIHPCSTYPTSDMEIDVPPYDALKELK